MLPDWSGPPARLAETVVALGVALGLSQVAGSFGGFRPGVMFVAIVATGVILGVTTRPAPHAPSAPADPADPSPSPGFVRSLPAEIVGAVAVGALVVAQWSTHIAFAFNHGITEGDTLWYHGPFSAHFVQTGYLTRWSETGLAGLGTRLHSYLPLNSEVLHGLLIMPFDRDILSPLVNLGWAALALLAAWCLGRRYGVGALCVLGTLVALGVPTIVGTEPGQGTNNIAVGALFLAAVALLFEGRLAPAPTALAGVAAGLALSTKLTVAAPLAVLTIGVVVLTLRARRPLATALWCGGLAVSGSYWLIRNWVASGNPLPFFSIDVGPLSFDALFSRRPTIAEAAGYGWRRFYLPGLSDAWGRLWPMVVLLMLAGLVLAIVRGRYGIERVVGAAMLIGIVSYVNIPGTGEFAGASFVFTVRYLTVTLLVGFALLARALAGARRWRTAVAISFVAIAAFNAVTPSEFDITALWPEGEWLVGVLVGVAVIVVAMLWPTLRTRGAAHGPLLALLIVVAVLVGGWMLQRHYLQERYLDAGLTLDAAHEALRGVHDEKIAVFGNQQLYALFGTDLSNAPAKVRGPKHGSAQTRCRRWRTILRDRHYRYVVLDHQLFSDPGPDEAWISSDPASTRIVRDGTSVVYRIDGQLDPDACAAIVPAAT